MQIKSYWESGNIDKLIDIWSDHINVVALPSPQELLVTEFGTDGVMYHTVDAVRPANVFGPLVLTFSSAVPISKRIGTLKVTTSADWDHPNGLRCI